MRSGTGIMTADKQHLHYRLLEIGHSHRRAVLILYAWSALLAGSVVALSFTGPRRVLPFFLVVVACGIFGLLSPRWRRRPIS
jgi:UDP-GlcNAc:undecaprenyl-phosphate GlcNAc-1-phosphate transferase